MTGAERWLGPNPEADCRGGDANPTEVGIPVSAGFP